MSDEEHSLQEIVQNKSWYLQRIRNGDQRKENKDHGNQQNRECTLQYRS